MHILIINPATEIPGYHSGEAFAAAGLPARTPVADLAITTVAAFVPPDWDIRLVDEMIQPLDIDEAAGWCDIVAITGKVTQRNRMIELATLFRARGRTVMIGGSYASLSTEDVRPHADVLVTGEIEDIAAGLFADLATGTARPHYQGGRPDLRSSPVPRWDLYHNGGAVMGALQTSRGCPFQCDFCDVIAYLGRKQRHKDKAQVWAELDMLYRHGYRSIFLADDNFTVYRQHAHAMLDTLRQWQAKRPPQEQMRFMTQASLDLARDADLLKACVSAGLDMTFIGIETVNEESLRGASKRQNLYQDTNIALKTILNSGIAVQGGMVVGFDADRPDIFGTLFDFIQSSPVPLFSMGALVAPSGTPLYERLKAEGRLIGDDGQSAGSFTTNILPLHMSRQALMDGVRDLAQQAYAPLAFEKRMMNFLNAFHGGVKAEPQLVAIAEEVRALLKFIARLGLAEKAMVLRLLSAAQEYPQGQFHLVGYLVRYAQIRFMLNQLAVTRAAA
jgi:radical SAM superfamily enzyme YgiQ (UPF0313 family)